ncbi:MAG: hypothetical protein KZQ80_02420 [Candidatus Thiodiazotropha sp. (ex Monitilora ramsayi)]|nr:hypothetical protein [Candidatus Thiodiazotropha sp. (ex Monitilora ramsayi)]
MLGFLLLSLYLGDHGPLTEIMARGRAEQQNLTLVCRSIITMCITIPSSANVKRAGQWMLWHWLSALPLRLFTFAGAVSLLAMVLQMSLSGDDLLGWPLYNLLFAILPSILLGPLFAFLPNALRVTAMGYVRTASLFFMIMASQLAFHAAALLGATPGVVYLLFLVLVWGMIIITIKGMLTVSYGSAIGLARILFVWLWLAGAAGLVLGLSLLVGWLQALPVSVWVVPLLYSGALLSLVALVVKRKSIHLF